MCRREYMFSMEQLTRIFGDGRFGDILEKVAFNAPPAAISRIDLASV